jgi:hypothetical protein
MKYRTPLLMVCAALLAMPVVGGSPDKATDAAAAPSADAKPLKLAKHCAAVTGTRIRPKLKDNCESAARPNRTFTQEDLQRTGQIDINEALRRLDPSFH